MTAAIENGAYLANSADEQGSQPTAYGIARVSTDRQQKSGLGLDSQDKIIDEYYMSVLKPRGVAFGELAIDAISAFKNRLLARPEAGRVFRNAKAGDHLIVAKHDRAFRRVFDLAATFDELEKRGIFLHVISMRFDSSNREGLIWGKAMLQIMTVMAELESEMMSQRQKDVNAIRRLQGRAIGMRTPLGFKVVGPTGKKVLVPDEEQRKAMRFIVEQVERGYGFGEVARHLKANGIMRRRRDKKHPCGFTWEFWHWNTVQRAYWRMKQIAEAEAAAAAET